MAVFLLFFISKTLSREKQAECIECNGRRIIFKTFKDRYMQLLLTGKSSAEDNVRLASSGQPYCFINSMQVVKQQRRSGLEGFAEKHLQPGGKNDDSFPAFGNHILGVGNVVAKRLQFMNSIEGRLL